MPQHSNIVSLLKHRYYALPIANSPMPSLKTTPAISLPIDGARGLVQTRRPAICKLNCPARPPGYAVQYTITGKSADTELPIRLEHYRDRKRNRKREQAAGTTGGNEAGRCACLGISVSE